MKFFPTDAEYGASCERYPVPQLALVDPKIEAQFSAHSSYWFGNVTLQEWFIHLSNRMIQARKAYHLMRYFFDLGIPDDRPLISPGAGGVSVEYFPDFKDGDHSKLAWFSFYADAFAFKLFSAFDSIGQLLVVVHGLKLKEPSFARAVTALCTAEAKLGHDLRAMIDTDAFKRLRGLRHDTTHNFLPGVFGDSVKVEHHPGSVTLRDGAKVAATKSISFGVGKYIKTKDMVRLANEALDVFDETLRTVGLR